MAKYKNFFEDNHFYSFLDSLKPILSDYGDNTEKLQKKQVESIMKFEKEFRLKLVRNSHGADIYKKFIDHIFDVKKNILMARPYFRERDVVFKAKISPALKTKDYRRLYRFNINYQFVNFVLNQRKWDGPADKQLIAVANKIKNIRNEIAECNMPLAISQAKIFFSRNKGRSVSSFMDMNQLCFAGLLEGIDKYVGKYHRRFRAVLIGRMLGNLIEANSETLIHFYPPDKKRIYRARKIIGQMAVVDDHGTPELDLYEVCSRLNKFEKIKNIDRKENGKIEDRLTTPGELYNLLAATTIIPSSQQIRQHESVSRDRELSTIDDFIGTNDTRPDFLLEKSEAENMVSKAIGSLGILERKIIKMKGVEL